MSQDVFVGYEIGTKRPVSVPIAHMVVVGQTQASGKTTALDAMARRASFVHGKRALAFITKRGESAFQRHNSQAGRTVSVKPFFKDHVDWQSVSALFDSLLQEKNRFLRSWIIKACRNAKTLEDVHSNIKTALKTARGINEGVYTQLDAYMALLIPEVKRARGESTLGPFTPSPGVVSVINMAAASPTMHGLYLLSAIDNVNQYLSNTIVIIPEAWEAIPEHRNAPAKMAAIALARKGAAIGNFLWVDAQDTAAISKEVLRGCGVWLIGVQREANEIKRNLSNIPEGIRRPRPGDIARLRRGQFFVCWKDMCVRTYVQPEWLDAHAAELIALRDEDAPPRMVTQDEEDETVNQTQQIKELAEKLAAAEAELALMRMRADTRPRAVHATSLDNPGPRIPVISRPAPEPSAVVTYEEFRDRLLEELPGSATLLKILASQPELMIETEKTVISVRESSPEGRIGLLIRDGFFDAPKNGYVVFKELKARGVKVARATAYQWCNRLVSLGP